MALADVMTKERIVSLIDLTSLADTDTPASINALCDKALAASVQVAAVCVYPLFLSIVTQRLKHTSIQCAVVANFPQGIDALDDVVNAIKQSVANGAQEIDVVFPYQSYLQGATHAAEVFIQHCKVACGQSVLLKVILETGALTPAEIAAIANCALTAGANFLKTSTGKISTGATLAAVEILLRTIKASPRNIGVKVSGGVRTLEQAIGYIALAEKIMGKDWVRPTNFRIGASQLFDTLTFLQ